MERIRPTAKNRGMKANMKKMNGGIELFDMKSRIPHCLLYAENRCMHACTAYEESLEEVTGIAPYNQQALLIQ